MKAADCKEYLTYKRIEEVYKMRPAGHLSGEGAEFGTSLHKDRVEGCMHTCYREAFIQKSITAFSSYRECDVEELAEEAFYEVIPKFLTYVVEKGLDSDSQIAGLFFVFYDRKLHSTIRKKKEVLNINARSKTENDIINLSDDDVDPTKEKRFFCLEQFLQQKDENGNPIRDVTIILWRHFERLSIQEITEKLDTTYSYTTTLIERCMKRSRAFIEKCKKNRYENKH